MEENLKYSRIPALLAAERRELEKYLSSAGGYYLLLLGSHRQFSDLPKHRLQSITLSPGRDTRICSKYDNLAVRPHSIDIVLLPYLLEYHAQPNRILKELHQSLTGEGKLFVWGFERFHPWCWLHAPSPYNTLSLWKVKKLLNNANFSVQKINYIYYGAVYFIIAQKQVITLTPLHLRWEKKPIELKQILAGAADIKNYHAKSFD